MTTTASLPSSLPDAPARHASTFLAFVPETGRQTPHRHSDPEASR